MKITEEMDCRFTVLYEFTAEDEGEMSVAVGDELYQVSSDHSDDCPEGWIFVRKILADGSEYGYVPRDYIEQEEEQEEVINEAPEEEVHEIQRILIEPIPQPREELPFPPLHSIKAHFDTKELDFSNSVNSTTVTNLLNLPIMNTAPPPPPSLQAPWECTSPFDQAILVHKKAFDELNSLASKLAHSLQSSDELIRALTSLDQQLSHESGRWDGAGQRSKSHGDWA